MTDELNPDDFIISRKRKLYKFALFANSPLCFEVADWQSKQTVDTLELGAGTALLSVAMARANPKTAFLAVDVKADRLQVGATAAAELDLDNLLFLRARAGQLPELLRPQSLQKIWVTFPDPFPKDRMAKNRLTHSTYLAIYQTLLSSDGSLYFKTDASGLFTWSLEQLVAAGWQINELTFDLHESDLPDEYKTKTTYESRYMADGFPICFLRANPPKLSKQ